MVQRGLVVRAGRGDMDAFGALVDGSLARLDAIARLILRDTELARDAVQEALVRAWRDLPGLRDPDRFEAWLHRLTVHACIDLARRRRRRVIEVELTPDVEPPFADASAFLADRDQLDRALARLDPQQRAAVVLRFYLELSLQETADALGVPLGTAKSRLHRALDQLRLHLTIDDTDGAADRQERIA
ncbi:MAG: RNA polymerase sigma factor [Chloroflexota bacterium]